MVLKTRLIIDMFKISLIFLERQALNRIWHLKYQPSFVCLQRIQRFSWMTVLEWQRLHRSITERIWFFFFFHLESKISEVKVIFEDTKRARFQKPSSRRHDHTMMTPFDRKMTGEIMSFYIPHVLCAIDILCPLESKLKLCSLLL